MREEPKGSKACTDAAPCPTLRTRVHRLALPAPLDAHAWPAGPRGRSWRLAWHGVGALDREAMAVSPYAPRAPREPSPPCPARLPSLCSLGRCWRPLAGVWGQCPASGDRATPRHPRAAGRRHQHRGPTRGDGLGSAGHKPHQGEPAWPPVAPEVGGARRGAARNLKGGCAAPSQRTGMCQAGRRPHRTDNPRHRTTTTPGRKRFCNEARQALRMRVARTGAWEDTCQRLLLRFARLQPRP